MTVYDIEDYELENRRQLTAFDSEPDESDYLTFPDFGEDCDSEDHED